MALFALGLNHATAPVEVRERVAFATSTPTSITVVATSTWIFPATKSAITAAF